MSPNVLHKLQDAQRAASMVDVLKAPASSMMAPARKILAGVPTPLRAR